MIKINLATRKQSSVVAANAAGKGPKISVNLDGIKDLPIRKLLVPIVAAVAANWALESYKKEELQKYQNELQQIQAKTEVLQKEIAKIRGADVLRKTLEEDEQKIRSKLDTITKLLMDRSYSPKMLLALSGAVPVEVWITDFTVLKNDVLIKGGATGFSQISDFMKSLEESAFFGELSLKNTQQQKDEQGLDVAVFELAAQKRGQL